MGNLLAAALMSLAEPLPVSARPQLVGPPAPRSIEVRQLQGRDLVTKRNFMKDLAPLLAAQALDLLTTEAMIQTGNGKELNPLPGMKSTAGRVGWGALEAALAHILTKDRPKLREVAVKNIMPGVHGALSMNNAALTHNEDVIDMIARGKR